MFLNPCLSVLSDRTQEFLRDIQAGLELRNWVDNFVRRKQHKAPIGMNPVYGDNSTFWLRCCNPRRLPTLLSALPNSSAISVVYGSQFLFPEARLSALDMSKFKFKVEIQFLFDKRSKLVSQLT